MLVYVRRQSFVSSWLLFPGNMLFGIGSAIFMLRHVQHHREGKSSGSTITLGYFVTIDGVVLSCLFSFIALLIIVPEATGAASDPQIFQHAPTQMQDGSSNGFVTVLFMTSIIGNVSVGSFITIILAYTAKRKQTTDKEPTFLNEKRV